MSAPTSHNRFDLIRDIAETLAFAAAGGLTLGLLGMPAGYLSGSILAVAIAALAGRPMTIPAPVMRVLLVLIGVSLGAVVTPETLQGLTSYPLSIGILLIACICINVTGTFYLRQLHGWDTLTAFLASSPGGLSQVVAIAVDLKVDVRAIAIVQSVRVVIVAVGLPALLLMLGLTGHGGRSLGGPFDPAHLGELILLVAIAAAGAALFYRLRLPGGLLFGAMISSAALHGSGYVHVLMPWWVAYSVMIAFGAVIGARFANTPLRLLMNYIGAALGSFAVAIVVTGLFAGALVAILHLPLAEVMIAYAPGAVDAMMLLALALNLDPVYVGAHHLARIVFILLVLPFVVRGSAHRLMSDVEASPELAQPPFED